MISSIYIAKSVYGGDGLGRLGDGRVVFVPGTFAGEQVKAEIIQEKKTFVKARLIEIEDPSPERIGTNPAPIPGAVYWNLSVKGEKEAKRSQLAEFFERNRIKLPENCDLAECSSDSSDKAAFNYRNKVVYHFSGATAERVLGYREEPSHKIVDITEDPLARAEINAKLPEIRDNVFRLLSTGPKAVRKSVQDKENVTIRFSERSGVVWWMGNAPENVTIKEVTAGKVFEVPSDGFYQVNPAVGEDLVKAVVQKFKANPTKEVLDLYCGVGVFGLCMEPERLTGIESGRRAIDFARKNAIAHGRTDARFYVGQVGHDFRRLKITEDTTVVVDPPRGGMEYAAARGLARSAAKRIFYVSCDPATLMRDLKMLSNAYEVEDVKWFNMFPRTARFETLVVLKKRQARI